MPLRQFLVLHSRQVPLSDFGCYTHELRGRAVKCSPLGSALVLQIARINSEE